MAQFVFYSYYVLGAPITTTSGLIKRGGLHTEVKINSKGVSGTQPSGLYREVVSVQRSKSIIIAKELLGPLWIYTTS